MFFWWIKEVKICVTFNYISFTIKSEWLSLFFFFLFYFIFKLYIIVLVLPNIKMNPPQVYLCSPSWTLLPPHSIPLGRPSAPAPSIQYCASNLDWRLVSYMIFYMFQCHSPKSSHPLPLFPTFFNLSLNLPIKNSRSEPQSAPDLVFADCVELLNLWLQRI